MKTKQNAVDLTDLAVGIIVLGIVVTIGANILVNVRDTQLTELDILSTSAEAVTGSNTTAVSLDNPWFATVGTVTNATSGVTIGAGNYTVATNPVSGEGQFLVVGSQFNGVPLKVNYTYYDITQPSWAVADEAATGLAEYGNWFDIIVIVGVAAVILSLIFMAFGRDGEGNKSVSY